MEGTCAWVLTVGYWLRSVYDVIAYESQGQRFYFSITILLLL